jgi:tetratricopeptide (TPR) repeat protein
MSEQALTFVQQASEAIQRQEYEQAIALVEQAIDLDPGNSDAYVIKGIALAQTGKPQGAVDAFRDAISRNPENGKAYFNYATHAYRQNERETALAMAREALRVDPRMTSARELIDIIERETSASAEHAGSVYVPYGAAPSGAYERPGYTLPAHSIEFVGRLGPKWTYSGWAITILGLVLFVISLIVGWPELSRMFEAAMRDPQGSQNVGTGFSPASLVINLVSILAQIAAMAWLIMDIADRRGNWLWMIPFVICCCCSLHWMVLPIYLVAGRR